MTTLLSSTPVCPWGCLSPDKKNFWENPHLVIERIKSWNVGCWQIINDTRTKQRACVWALHPGCKIPILQTNAQPLVGEMFVLHQDPAGHSKSLRSAGYRDLHSWNINPCLLKELLTSSTAWEVCCHSCNIRVRSERSCGFIIIPYTKEYFLQYQINPNLNYLQRVQYSAGFSMQDQRRLSKIYRCFCPSQAAHSKCSFLNITPGWSLKKILQTIIEGKTVTVTAVTKKSERSAWTDKCHKLLLHLLKFFKNIELNTIPYFNKKKESINRDVQNFKSYTDIIVDSLLPKVKIFGSETKLHAAIVFSFNVRWAVDKWKKSNGQRKGVVFVLEDEIHFKSSFFMKRRLKKDISLHHSENNYVFLNNLYFSDWTI